MWPGAGRLTPRRAASEDPPPGRRDKEPRAGYLPRRAEKGDDDAHGTTLVRTQEITLMSREPATAPGNPLTWRPGTMAETRHRSSPLITRRNSPSVTTVTGSGSRTNTARMRAVTRPATNPRAMAPHAPAG